MFVRSGTSDAARDAVEWAREAEACGAGEILLTSMDRDGTRAGFDCEMTAAVSDAVNIPVIASGGAGTFEHFTDVFTAGHADAALAASIFHYAESSVADLKRYLRERGIPYGWSTGPCPDISASQRNVAWEPLPSPRVWAKPPPGWGIVSAMARLTNRRDSHETRTNRFRHRPPAGADCRPRPPLLRRRVRPQQVRSP